MTQTFSNSGTFDGLTVTAQLTVPENAGTCFEADIRVSESGIAPEINVAIVIDRSGSTGNDTGIDFDGDGDDDNFLEAQVFAAKVLMQELEDAGYGDNATITIVDYATSARSLTLPLSAKDDIESYIDSFNSSGSTNYEAALGTLESALDAAGADPAGSNFAFYFSDGFPFPASQDFSQELNSLNAAYDIDIKAVGFGPNTSEPALDAIDSNGNATIVTTEAELAALLDTPPPLPDIESFDIVVDGTVIETIAFDDPRVVSDPTTGSFSIVDYTVEGYPPSSGNPQDLDVAVVVNFSNGETLAASGPVNLLDGTVEGTAGDDVIDAGYDGDPEGDRIDSADNVDCKAPVDQQNDDLVFAFAGNDVVMAGDGADEVYGGDGDDTLSGGAGDDTLSGDAGDDLLSGGDGADTLFGGDDRDTFTGVGDGDSVAGGEGGDDFDTLDLTGAGSLRINYTGGDPASEAGTVVFYDGTGFEASNITGTMTFEEIESVIPCFTPGTLIATPRGEVPVEDLRVGDRVMTRDNGLQEIRWTGHRAFGARDMAATPHLRPVLIRAGSLRAGLPERDMLVSPNHRLLIAGEATQLYFDESEVLVAAKHLVGKAGIHRVDVARTTYVHFMFDRHEVVLSDGAWTESFQPGDWSLKGIDAESRDEIFALFPDLAQTAGRAAYAAARVSLKKHEARLLVD